MWNRAAHKKRPGKELSQMSFIPKPQEIYKHFKGNLYQITAVAEHTETGELLVVYQALYGEFKTYARPLDLFTSRVDREKYPDAAQEFRFELQGPEAPSLSQADDGGKDAEEECVLDPQVLAFLDADGYEERLNILTGLHHRITDEMITTMAIACDVEIGAGDVEERYEALKTCLVTRRRYECTRIR